MVGLFKVLAVAVSSAALTACVSDPTVENDVPAQPGVHQPGADGGSTLGASEACARLVDAEQSARSKLKCDAAKDLACPGYVALAGALPCDLYEASTVAACVAAVGHYAACSDFDTKPCVVTAVVSSCHAPVAPEAGADAAKPGPDASPLTDGGGPDGSGSPSDGSAPQADTGVPDTGAPDVGAPPVDAAPHPG